MNAGKRHNDPKAWRDFRNCWEASMSYEEALVCAGLPDSPVARNFGASWKLVFTPLTKRIRRLRMHKGQILEFDRMINAWPRSNDDRDVDSEMPAVVDQPNNSDVARETVTTRYYTSDEDWRNGDRSQRIPFPILDGC
jgi:hypothetical protein